MVFALMVRFSGGYYGLRSKYKKSSSRLKRKMLNFILQGYQHETNAYLPFNNEIKGPVNFLHGTYGIFISGDSVIGDNCTIYQQATIGSNMLIDSKNLGSPVIGNNCLIGAGAKVIGKIAIGNNCRIGANAVVTKDMPDNSVAYCNTTITVKPTELHNKVYQSAGSDWGYRENGIFIKERDEKVLQQLENIYTR